MHFYIQYLNTYKQPYTVDIVILILNVLIYFICLPEKIDSERLSNLTKAHTAGQVKNPG